MATLLSGWWKPNALKTIRWKKVVKTKWLAHVIELALGITTQEHHQQQGYNFVVLLLEYQNILLLSLFVTQIWIVIKAQIDNSYSVGS